MLRIFTGNKTEVKEILNDSNNCKYFEWFIMNEMIILLSSHRIICYEYSVNLEMFLKGIKSQYETLKPFIDIVEIMHKNENPYFMFNYDSFKQNGKNVSITYEGKNYYFNPRMIPNKYKNVNKYYYRLTSIRGFHGLVIYDKTDDMFNAFICGLKGV